MVQNAPIAFCDRRSVQPADLIEIDKVLPDYTEEELCLLHKKHHAWYWLSAHQPEEMAVFVQWNGSSSDHTSRKLPGDGLEHLRS